MTADVRAWIGTVLRIALAGILGYAGIVKLLETNGAREAIIAYRVFPASWVTFLGWALPTAEVVLALLLLIGLFTRWAAVATALLMVGFIIGISSVWIRGYSIDCGCFGGGGDISGAGKTWRYTSEILRDLLFTGMAVWLVAWPRTKFSFDGPGRSAVTTEDSNDESDAVTGVGAEGTIAR
ncbi:MAG TPA: MauE/DoxX family redox-associated membrane protein [Candidatus Nanopelagicales bacterium]